jgi:homoserine acetyltransferase
LLTALSGGEAAVKTLVDFLAKDPNWNGGWYYDKGGVTGILTEMRVATLKRLARPKYWRPERRGQQKAVGPAHGAGPTLAASDFRSSVRDGQRL